MKFARLAVLGIAVVAGFFAWRLAGNLGGDGGAVVVEQDVATDQVLVARRDIEPGSIIRAADLTWESWPDDSINGAFVTRSAAPDAVERIEGAVARTSFFSGEPIRESKIARSGSGGYMAAVLPSGMRAMATRTSPQTGAGGFILPNDRVDVVVTHEAPASRSTDAFVSKTVLENVRVLAIDQTVEEKDGRMDVVGNVATLELRPDQVEVLALAEQLGEISLSLRSIMDGEDRDEGPMRGRGSVNVVKFGLPKQVSAN